MYTSILYTYIILGICKKYFNDCSKHSMNDAVMNYEPTVFEEVHLATSCSTHKIMTRCPLKLRNQLETLVVTVK